MQPSVLGGLVDTNLWASQQIHLPVSMQPTSLCLPVSSMTIPKVTICSKQSSSKRWRESESPSIRVWVVLIGPWRWLLALARRRTLSSLSIILWWIDGHLHCWVIMHCCDQTYSPSPLVFWPLCISPACPGWTHHCCAYLPWCPRRYYVLSSLLFCTVFMYTHLLIKSNFFM